MALTPSPEALKHGYDLAKGWDKQTLLSEFRGLNEDNDVTDVDKAWLGFCKFTGPHPSSKPYKVTGTYDPRDKPCVILNPEHDKPCWDAWLAHFKATGHPEYAERAVKNGTLKVPSRWPKAEKVAA